MYGFRTSLLLNWERTPSVIYSDELASSIVSQSESNNVKIDLKINAVFNFLKIFCSCSVHHYKTSSVNFVRNAATSAKNLMNCQ